MKHPEYAERDYEFGKQVLTLRSAMELTQAGLADLLGISRMTVVAWEGGTKYPKAEHLRALIELAVERHAFPQGSEAEAIQRLWEASHQRALIGSNWWSTLGLSTESTTSENGFSNPATDFGKATPTIVQKSRYRDSLLRPTSFVGRTAELREITDILGDPGCRLLTLAGPGGIGKTRLALEIALLPLNAFADGVCFIALAALNAASQLVSTLGESLGLSFAGQVDALHHLLDYLSRRNMLLILDNFEHLIAGAELVHNILHHAPNVKILVTSRERLNLSAEWLFDVIGLEYPVNENSQSNQQSQMLLENYSAVQLFVQRTLQVRPKYPITPDTLEIISRICQQIAGMPLAIELAAASMRNLSILEIESYISSNLDMLATTFHDVPARHRSLRAVFDHSWHLMSSHEQESFVRLAVFRGGFTQEAAQQVAGINLTTVVTLFDKSLLHQEKTVQSSSRFHMLEAIREYAQEKLEEGNGHQSLRNAHALYYLAVAKTVQAQWMTQIAENALEELDRERDNINTALQWSVNGGDLSIGLEFADALVRYWRSRVKLDEARQWLVKLLHLTAKETDPYVLTLRMKTIYAAAMIFADSRDYTQAGLLFEQSRQLRQTLGIEGDETQILVNQSQQARTSGDYRQATMLLEETLAQYRLRGEFETFTRGGYGFVLYFLAHILREQGNYSRAASLYHECREFHLRVGDREGAAQGLLGLSDIARDLGNINDLKRYCNKSLSIYREFGTQWAIGFCLNNLALAAFLEGALDEADSLIGECVAMFRTQQANGSIAEVLLTLAKVRLAQGNPIDAHKALIESLELGSVTGPRILLAAGLEELGNVFIQLGQIIDTVRCLATATKLRQEMGAPIRTCDVPSYETTLATARNMLDLSEFEALWSKAQEEPLGQYLQSLI